MNKADAAILLDAVKTLDNGIVIHIETDQVPGGLLTTVFSGTVQEYLEEVDMRTMDSTRVLGDIDVNDQQAYLQIYPWDYEQALRRSSSTINEDSIE